MAKRIWLALFIWLMSAGILQAQEKSPFLQLKNGLSIRAGYHFYAGSDFTDYWSVKKTDIDGAAVEVAYERELIRHLGLEVALGFYRSDQEYNYQNLVFSGDTAKLDTTITNTYLSLTLKPHFPVTKSLQLYLGVGPDLYYTQGNFTGEYQRGGSRLRIDETENKVAFGGHGVGGAEFIVFKQADALFGTVKDAVSLFLEYKYSYVPVKDFDKKVTQDINAFAGSSVSSHDLNVGGHFAFFGLRWRF